MGISKRLAGVVVCTFLFFGGGARRAVAQEKAYVPVHRYAPARDAQRDIDAAVVEAKRTGKRVLVEVGGAWCSWCHTMDRFFQEHPDLLTLRERHFIMVKVSHSKENENQRLFSKYPRIPGYPHLFVLDPNGKLLRSQNTSTLEEGKSYNFERFFAFLRHWAPPTVEETK